MAQNQGAGRYVVDFDFSSASMTFCADLSAILSSAVKVPRPSLYRSAAVVITCLSTTTDMYWPMCELVKS